MYFVAEHFYLDSLGNKIIFFLQLTTRVNAIKPIKGNLKYQLIRKRFNATFGVDIRKSFYTQPEAISYKNREILELIDEGHPITNTKQKSGRKTPIVYLPKPKQSKPVSQELLQKILRHSNTN